jgi:hypothetical protein
MNRELKTNIFIKRPDISFHLIFCFLDLRELAIIAQCSHDFRRMVTNRSFLNMYSYEKDVTISSTNKLYLLSSSSFKHAIQNIDCVMHLVPQEFNILDDLCFCFPKLTTLTISIKPQLDIHFVNISAISQLRNLESLAMNFHVNVEDCPKIHPMFIDKIRLLPAIRILKVYDLFIFFDYHYETFGLENLRRLCAQPGAPKYLTTLCLFDGDFISDHQVEECAQLLEKLPSLNSIELRKIGNMRFPKLLAKWVTHIDVYNRQFPDTSDLIYFNRLDFIELNDCSISCTDLKQIITVHANRLETLRLWNVCTTQASFLDTIITFDTISQCIALTNLHIVKCRGLVESEFHLLNKCRKIKQILIHNCGFTIEQKNALEIRSNTFPLLTRCEIH